MLIAHEMNLAELGARMGGGTEPQQERMRHLLCLKYLGRRTQEVPEHYWLACIEKAVVEGAELPYKPQPLKITPEEYYQSMVAFWESMP